MSPADADLLHVFVNTVFDSGSPMCTLLQDKVTGHMQAHRADFDDACSEESSNMIARVMAAIAIPVSEGLPLADANMLRLFSNHMDAVFDVDSSLSASCDYMQRRAIARMKAADVKYTDSDIASTIVNVWKPHANANTTSSTTGTLVALRIHTLLAMAMTLVMCI